MVRSPVAATIGSHGLIRAQVSHEPANFSMKVLVWNTDEPREARRIVFRGFGIQLTQWFSGAVKVVRDRVMSLQLKSILSAKKMIKLLLEPMRIR
jgi:hypothetical protein